MGAVVHATTLVAYAFTRVNLSTGKSRALGLFRCRSLIYKGKGRGVREGFQLFIFWRRATRDADGLTPSGKLRGTGDFAGKFGVGGGGLQQKKGSAERDSTGDDNDRRDCGNTYGEEVVVMPTLQQLLLKLS